MEGVSDALSLIAEGKKSIEPSRDSTRVVSEIVAGWDEMLKRLDEGWEVDQELDKHRFLMKRNARRS